jgi:hypothetical protein
MLVLLLSAAMIKPALAEDLDAYAETDANAFAGHPDNDFDGPYQRHAECLSADAGMGPNGGYVVVAESVVDVWIDPQGNRWGPYPTGRTNRGIGIYMMGFGPMSGTASALGWYEVENHPFFLEIKHGIYILIQAHGGTEWSISLGIIVTDMDGTVILYDVAIECGVVGGKGYFNQTQTVGEWPQDWVVTPPGSPFILARQDSFAMRFEPVGLARATLYVHGTIPTQTLSSSSSQESLSNSEKDTCRAYFIAPTVGGVALSVDKLGLLAPYIGLASTIVVATVATTLYAKRVKRRKEK